MFVLFWVLSVLVHTNHIHNCEVEEQKMEILAEPRPDSLCFAEGLASMPSTQSGAVGAGQGVGED